MVTCPGSCSVPLLRPALAFSLSDPFHLNSLPPTPSFTYRTSQVTCPGEFSTVCLWLIISSCCFWTYFLTSWILINRIVLEAYLYSGSVCRQCCVLPFSGCIIPDCFIFSYDKVESVDSGVVTQVSLLYTVCSRDLFSNIFWQSQSLSWGFSSFIFFVTALLDLSLPFCYFLFVYPFFPLPFLLVRIFFLKIVYLFYWLFALVFLAVDLEIVIYIF